MTQGPTPGKPEQKKKPQKQGSWLGTIIFLVFVLARPAMSLLQNLQGMAGSTPIILIGVAALVGVGVLAAVVVPRINAASRPASSDIAQYTARSSYPTQPSYTAPSAPRYPSAQRLPPPSPAPKPPQFEPVISLPVMITGVVGLVLLGLLAILLLIPQAGI